MRIGLYLGNKGPEATRSLLLDCARIADGLPIDDLWVYDHIAVPREESEGSGGLYIDPLATLAFIAGVTERVGIGTGVLILPYRPLLPTAKWVASIQALSGGRLRLGVGVGWMEAEFKALGVDRSRRGAITDETLELLHRCFADDEVEINGQRFLFLPRPERPPIYVGGMSPQAVRRAALLADGWMPTMADADALKQPIVELRRLAAEAGRPAPEVLASGRSDITDENELRDRLAALAELGVTGVALNGAFSTAGEFARNAERLARASGR